MGLRFRKTISILPGVRLNLAKSSVGVSLGVPGMRASVNSKGRLTTTLGLPGTGISYVKTKSLKKMLNKGGAKEKPARSARKTAPVQAPAAEIPVQEAPAPKASPRRQPFVPQIQRRSIVGANSPSFVQIDRDSLIYIHKTADDTIPWADVAASPDAPDPSYNQEMWSYYHSMAPQVLAGDIDAYLQLIYEVNPLEDLLEFGSGFTFGTDDPARMEVEFDVNTDALISAKASLLRTQYNQLLLDYICSTAIRAARDLFALLPVQEAAVHARLKEETVLSVVFDRATMEKIRFGFIDPSDTIARFNLRMNYSDEGGFAPVEPIE